jgi:hypothetical protein
VPSPPHRVPPPWARSADAAGLASPTLPIHPASPDRGGGVRSGGRAVTPPPYARLPAQITRQPSAPVSHRSPDGCGAAVGHARHDGRGGGPCGRRFHGLRDRHRMRDRGRGPMVWMVSKPPPWPRIRSAMSREAHTSKKNAFISFFSVDMQNVRLYLASTGGLQRHHPYAPPCVAGSASVEAAGIVFPAPFPPSRPWPSRGRDAFLSPASQGQSRLKRRTVTRDAWPRQGGQRPMRTACAGRVCAIAAKGVVAAEGVRQGDPVVEPRAETAGVTRHGRMGIEEPTGGGTCLGLDVNDVWKGRRGQIAPPGVLRLRQGLGADAATSRRRWRRCLGRFRGWGHGEPCAGPWPSVPT